MRTLVYKRTHNGDPDEQGVFGIRDCMGTVRARSFDAVIGVGGVGDEARREGIAEKITWIGIGPHKSGRPDRPQVTFDHYLFFGPKGPRFRDHAPALAEHVYDRNVRTIMTFSANEQIEVDAILQMARNAPPSRVRGLDGLGFPKSRKSCGVKAECRQDASAHSTLSACGAVER